MHHSIFNEVGSSKLVNGFYWDDTWYPVSHHLLLSLRMVCLRLTSCASLFREVSAMIPNQVCSRTWD